MSREPTPSEAATDAGTGQDVVRLAARALEHDRYLAALLAPADLRADLIALAAFAGEVGRVPGHVTEPMIGEIRLQWWREVIDDTRPAGEVAGHPIAAALTAAVTRHALPRERLIDAVDAQAERLNDAPFADADQLCANVIRFDSALTELAWQIRAGRSRGPVPSVIGDAGLAYGLARLLAELPIALSQGKLPLPLDRLAAHGASPDAALTADGLGAVTAVAREVLMLSRERYTRVAVAWPAAGRAERGAALPVALVRPYLGLSERQLERSLAAIELAPVTRVWRIAAAHWLGRL